MALTKIPAGLLDKSAHVDFANNEKLRFGAGSDLQIYSDGTHSRIYESGSGLLIIRAGNFNINNADGSQSYITMSDGGATTLYHAGAAKLATASGGASVTGNLAVSGNLTVSGTTTELDTTNLNVTDKNITLNYHASSDTSSNADGAGLTIQDAVNGSTDATLNWSAANDRFVMSHGLQVTSGNVGIGTDSPEKALHIKSISNQLRLQDSTNNKKYDLNVDGNNFSIDDMSAGASRFTIKDGGNVGIGIAAPTTALHVSSGDGNAELILERTGAQASLWGLKPYNADFYIRENGTDRITVKAGGNVGIGETNPNSPLHVKTTNQSIQVRNTGNDNVGLEIYRNSDGAKGASFAWGNGNANLEIKNYRNDGQSGGPYANIDFFTGGTNADSPDYAPTRRMRIQQTGEVGIGVDDPTAALEINRGSAPYGMILGSAQGSGRVMLFKDNHASPSKYQWLMGSQYNVNNAFEITPSTAVGGFTFTAGTGLTILETGNVLINSSSVKNLGFTTKLQIEGTGATSASQAIIRNSNSIDPPYFIFGKSRGTSNGSNTIVQNNDTLGRIRWMGADGNDMASAAAEINCIVNGTPGSNDMPGALIFSTTSDGAASTTERMRIDADGNVGIGDTNPQHPLKVHLTNGEIAMFGSNDMNSPGRYAGIGLGQVLANSTAHQKVSLVTEGRNDGNYRQDFHILVDGAADNGYAVLADRKFTIDGVWGTVSMPLQPSFMCYPAANYSNPSGSQKVSWTGEAHDVNNWYNNANHRFTAPVAGNYLFMGELALQASTLGQTYIGIGIRINGSGNIYYGGWAAKTGSGNQYEKVTSTIIKQLAANDYVEIYVELASATTVLGGAGGALSRFSGQLLS